MGKADWQRIRHLELEIDKRDQKIKQLNDDLEKARAELRDLKAEKQVFHAFINPEGIVKLVAEKDGRIEHLEAILGANISELQVFYKNIGTEIRDADAQLQLYQKEFFHVTRRIPTRATLSSFGSLHKYQKRMEANLKESLNGIMTVLSSDPNTEMAQVTFLVAQIVAGVWRLAFLNYSINEIRRWAFYEGDIRAIAQEIMDQLKAGKEPDIKFLEGRILEYVRYKVNQKPPGTAKRLQSALFIYQQFLDSGYKSETYVEERQLRNFGMYYRAIKELAEMDAEKLFNGYLSIPLMLRDQNSAGTVPPESGELR